MPQAKILIVDDTRANQIALEVLLKSVQATVVTVSSGEQALQEAERLDDIALILLDMHMPQMDGITFLKLQMKEYKIPMHQNTNGLRKT